MRSSIPCAPACRRAGVALGLLCGLLAAACAPTRPTLLGDFAPDYVPSPDSVYHLAQVMPDLVGGLEGLSRRVQYPESARRAGVQGTVFVTFVVDEEGRVRDAAVTRGIGAGADEAAHQAVLLSTFEPGRINGVPVKVRMSLPVRFRLREPEPPPRPR